VPHALGHLQIAGISLHLQLNNAEHLAEGNVLLALFDSDTTVGEFVLVSSETLAIGLLVHSEILVAASATHRWATLLRKYFRERGGDARDIGLGRLDNDDLRLFLLEDGCVDSIINVLRSNSYERCGIFRRIRSKAKRR
jgi:hypothetical protein